MSNEERIKSVVCIACMGIMALSILIIAVSLKTGESMTLLLVDIRTLFVDNGAFAKKLIYPVAIIFVFFAAWIIVTVFTGEFSWKGRLIFHKINIDFNSRFLSKMRNILFVLISVPFLTLSVIYLIPYVKLQRESMDNWKTDSCIAHAFWGIDGNSYSNCLEAFYANYEKGARTFEVDFSVTSDNRMVCWHGWENVVNTLHESGEILSEEEFMQAKIYDQYTPLTLKDLFYLMQQYEDIWIVTDTKGKDWETVQNEFEIMMDTAAEAGAEDTLDRFIVQLYTYEMLDAVESVHSFPDYILTLYQMGGYDRLAFTSHCRFCKDHGIGIITMWEDLVTEEHVVIAERYGIDLCVHTVNNAENLGKYQDMGVKGFYTDYLIPIER